MEPTVGFEPTSSLLHDLTRLQIGAIAVLDTLASKWSTRQASNLQPCPYKRLALSIELQVRKLAGTQGFAP